MLFATTIKNNVAYGGKLGNDSEPLATAQDVEAACRKANAHDFIMEQALKTHARSHARTQLCTQEKQYDTQCGSSAATRLSGACGDGMCGSLHRQSLVG